MGNICEGKTAWIVTVLRASLGCGSGSWPLERPVFWRYGSDLQGYVDEGYDHRGRADDLSDGAEGFPVHVYCLFCGDGPDRTIGPGTEVAVKEIATNACLSGRLRVISA